MVTITLENIKNLNVSLQVGDMIYGQVTFTSLFAEDPQAGDMGGSYGNTGEFHTIGVLRRISRVPGPVIDGDTFILDVDETDISPPFTFPPGNGRSFIMFSKYDQSIGDVIGYYAKARFENDSTEKAEIFSVGSEVIINSK